MDLLRTLSDCLAEKKHFRVNSNSNRRVKAQIDVFHLTKNIILQIEIPVTTKLQIPENVMSCVQSLVIDWATSGLNTASPSL